MTVLVQCNRAGDLDSCDACGHAEPHEREGLGPGGYWYPLWCSEWHECEDVDSLMELQPDIKVRCVRVEP